MQVLGISPVASVQILERCKKCNAVKITSSAKETNFFLFHVYLFLQNQTWNFTICPQGSYSKYDMDCMTRESCLNSQEGQEIVLSSKVSPATGHTCCVLK